MKMAKSDVKSESKVVGSVEYPVFDDKNPDLGVEEILGYDWSSVGYASAKEAIVKLVNTQHATNLKNDLRNKSSDKLTGEKLNNLALAELSKLPAEELSQLATSGTIAAKVDEFKASIKAAHEAARAARLAAAESEDEEAQQ